MKSKERKNFKLFGNLVFMNLLVMNHLNGQRNQNSQMMESQRILFLCLIFVDICIKKLMQTEQNIHKFTLGIWEGKTILVLISLQVGLKMQV
jgi:hypothetical protein